jgi:AAA domain
MSTPPTVTSAPAAPQTVPTVAQAAPAPNPFAGMEGTKSENVLATQRLKIAILGKPKTGKSWFASTAPGPIRYYDFDGRAESLGGKPGLYILSNPTMLQIETDLSVMKANKIKKLPLPATVVFDSVTYLNRAMEEEIFRQDPKLARTIRVGNSTSMKLRNSWDVINGIQRYVEYLIAELTALGVNFIFVFHETDEKDRTESTPTATAYTGLVTTDPQYLQNSLSMLNEVYRITVDGSSPAKPKYQVTCRPTNDVLASTTLLIDGTELPDISAMIAKHNAARAKQVAATPKA